MSEPAIVFHDVNLFPSDYVVERVSDRITSNVTDLSQRTVPDLLMEELRCMGCNKWSAKDKKFVRAYIAAWLKKLGSR